MERNLSRIGQAEGCEPRRSFAISLALPEHSVKFRLTCLLKSNVELSRSCFSVPQLKLKRRQISSLHGVDNASETLSLSKSVQVPV